MKIYEKLCKKHLTIPSQMVKILLTAFLVSLSSIVQAEFRHFDEWTKTEKTLYTSYVVASYIDHRQTRVGLRNGYREANPIFGENPHRDKSILINSLILAGTYYAVGAYEPDDWNGVLLGGNIARWGVVLHNDSIGVSWQVAF